jgi:putative chitinase
MATFADALNRLWPQGDNRIPALRAHMIGEAPAVFAKYGINNPTVLAHLMAQISHECGAGLEVVENLNYSPERMVEVWPSRFHNVQEAAPYAHNPKALANNVYNGRMGNRGGTDDGWDFRGRGAVQTTGRDGYQRLAKQSGLDVVNNPEMVNAPEHFLECGVADFILCGCLPYAIKNDIFNVTKRLNGGTVGLAQREQWLNRWMAEKVPVPQISGNPSPKAPDVVASAEPKKDSVVSWVKSWFS